MEWIDKVKYLEETDEMNYNGYYNGYSLLKKVNKTGAPEIFMCVGNRTGGKTFFFKRFMLRYFIAFKKQFLIVARKNTQVRLIADAFISDLKKDETFNDIELKTAKGEIAGITLILADEEIIGRVTYINNASNIKEGSSFFNETDIMFKDEFQEENGNYMENEINKIRSLHKSVARGFKKHSRYVPLILCSNEFSVINPYYVSLGIHKIINDKTKKLSGKGWTLERFVNQRAKEASYLSPFEMAFGADEYAKANNENIFMDNTNFIGKENTDKMNLFMQFYAERKLYTVWSAQGHFYIARAKAVLTKRIYAVDDKSHTENTIKLTFGDIITKTLIKYYNAGRVTFEDYESKMACCDLLGTAVF